MIERGRDAALAAHLAAIRAAETPEARLAAIDALAADPAIRVAELSQAVAALGLTSLGTTRAALLDTLRRPALAALMAAEKRRTMGGEGTL